MNTETKPYGSWRSPITSDVVASAGVRLDQPRLDGQTAYWLEMRPSQGGRCVVVQRLPDGQNRDVNPPPFNVRTRVHEYGGGAYTVADGEVFFSNFQDGRLYRQVPGQEPRPLTPSSAMHYADVVVDRAHQRLICVREDHTDVGREPLNTVVALPLSGGETGEVLVSGSDFYAFPRLSPDGTRLAWLTWNHPNMPWDGTELWVGEMAPSGSIGKSHLVAGGPAESIFQPAWSPDGVLHFVSDRTGWWNLYRWRDGRVELLCEMEAEFGRPLWTLGIATYAFVSPTTLLCTYAQRGVWHLAELDTTTGLLDEIETPYTELRDPQVSDGISVLLAGSPKESTTLLRLDTQSRTMETLRRSEQLDVDAGYLSFPVPVEFPTGESQTAYGFYYPPRNRDFVAPTQERPPLLVKCHGGPTSSTSTALRLEIQYWTSRGFAVLDVNYRGSTGYGRAYREQLKGRWGIADVEDCANGARYLVDHGEADGSRLAISGGSAGGYTVLCSLTFHDVFSAGAGYYGVSDLEALAQDTHKFESRYLDTMVGPYPEERELYRARSPINFTEQLKCPVIFFQGLEDKVVPPNQTERMVNALRSKGLPVAYLPYGGEQHGFRRAENIKRSLDAELYFYARIFGFELADPVEPVTIENLDDKT